VSGLGLEWRKKNEELIKSIKTLLDLRKFLELENDTCVSQDGKIKVYKAEKDLVRIDIKE
jgi:hypothetical protein